ncbi:MAG: hypothetical protein ACYCQK_03530 [Acidiferrobacteraceae bacterium]
MNSIPDFTDTELWTIRVAVNERYGHKVDIELADSELRLDPAVPVLTSCPTVFWSERGANFVISKIAESRYRCQFFYSVREQYGTGRETYDDLAECVTTLLQVQADHERDRAMTSGGNGLKN